MMKEWLENRRVFLAAGFTDLRRGTCGPAAIVSSEFQLDPFTEAAFVFCGRRRDRIKVLIWEGDGFCLAYNRLENGSFQWPRDVREAKELTRQQIRWFFEGLSIGQRQSIQPVRQVEIC